jgi:uncharacterized protein (TIGR02145 family)
MSTKISFYWILFFFIFISTGCGKEHNGKYYNTTTGLSLDGTSLLDFRDNNVYKVIKIGDQDWMAENLRYNPSAPNIPSYSLGDLYSWEILMDGFISSNANSSELRGLCPSEWHVPSNSEWTVLVDGLIPDVVGWARRRAVSDGLKSTTGWPTLYDWQGKAIDGNGTNVFGFNAISTSGASSVRFWSSTEKAINSAHSFDLEIDDFRQFNAWKTEYLFCRCIKD